MNRILKKLSVIILVAIIALMGCSSSTGTKKENSTLGNNSGGKDKLRIALAGSPPSLDIHRVAASLTQQIGANIFESLVAIDENQNVVPMLAESVETSDDGKEIIFILREGIKFHNGKELVADDVVASLNRWKELSRVGRSALSKSRIEAQGDEKVLIISEEPIGTILSSLSAPLNQAAIMPKEIIENASPEGVKEYIGTGPYKFVEWKQDQYIHLQKFDEYQVLEEPTSGLSGKKEAKIEELFYYTVPDSATRVAGIQSGEYDFADEIPYDNYEMIKEDSNLEIVINEESFATFGLNTKGGVFQNVKIRQAVNVALDIELILMGMTGNPEFHNANLSLVTESSPFYTDIGKENYNQNDPEKASKLLKEAGYNGEQVTIITTREYDYMYKSALILQDQLEEIGMTVEIEVYDWPSLISKASEEEGWDVLTMGFSQNTDPSHALFLDSRNEFFGNTKNPKMDSLLDEYRSALTLEEQKDVYNEIQQLFWEDIQYIKIGDLHNIYAHHKNLKDLLHTKNSPFWNAYLE